MDSLTCDQQAHCALACLCRHFYSSTKIVTEEYTGEEYSSRARKKEIPHKVKTKFYEPQNAFPINANNDYLVGS